MTSVFRIRDFIKPEGIDEMTTGIAELVNEGKTVFRLPFKNSPHQKNDIEHLKDRLCNLSKERSLLFLRHLEKVEWKDEHNAQTGSYACHRPPYDKIQSVPENESVELVELTGSLNGNNELSETFLVFRKKIHPPKDVIDKLLEQAEDEEEQQGIQQSAEELQPIEVAFKLQDDRITAMDDNCVLFAYLPTEKETHLKFLIQARYQTTPARDNIPKPSENPWNKWLVKETAKFLPEILEQLKASDLLEPAFFNVLPLKRDVENEFKPIAEALQKAMRERAFVPTQSGGYAKAENVFYPHRESLRELVESNWLYPNSSWLHPDIGETEEFRQCFKVIREAGVKDIDVSQVLDWLKKQDNNWFERRCEEWLRSLYIYLNSQGSELGRIKRLPLVRLENGRHVSTNNELVFFPSDTDEGREELRPFLRDLPILQSVLLDAEEGDDIKAFLGKLGVRVLNSEEMISKWIIPQYSWSDRPTKEQNRLHVRYIFKVWDKLGYEHRQLKEELSKVPILLAYNSGQPETYDFVKPCNAYLPEAYTGNADLETYFSVYNGDIWFVDSGYLDGSSNSKEWFKFLKAIGAMNTPRVDKIEVVGSSEECKKRGIIRQDSTRPFEGGEFKNSDRKAYQYFDGYIVDPCLVGLSQILVQIKERNGVNLSCAVWSLLIKAIEPLSSEIQRGLKKSNRDAFFQGTYHWYYYGRDRTERFESLFHRELIDTDWLPDEQGKLRRPSECYAPTDDNRKVLGDNMVYLHPDFDVSGNNGTARWLAEKLGIHLKADRDNVLKNLHTLSGTEASVEKVEPLYRFLDRQYTSLSEAFKQKPLIFTPNPESHWWRADEVFWEDKSKILGNDRRCLKVHYPATLKSFFVNLGVSEQASQRDYARCIQEIATTEQAADKKVRERLRRLYKCLITLQKHEWEMIYDDKCWLGKRKEEWGFFTRQELVLKDHPHIGEIFEGEVPFWTWNDDLSSLASTLKIEECSQAQVEFQSEGDQEENTDWSKKVRNLYPYIYAFLHSRSLSEEPEEEKLAGVLDQLIVCRVKELKVTYKLKGFPVTDPDPRQSFLDEQQAKLGLGLEVNESEYAEFIGDALQDHFGIKELGRFVEDLLTPTKKPDRVLSNWKRKGLETKFLNEYLKDDEKKRIESLDEKLLDEPNNGNTDPTADESDMRIPTDNQTPKTAGEGNDSVTADESETHFSRSGDNDSRIDEPGIETPVDSETSEMYESDEDSPLGESENYANLASDVIEISSPDTQSLTKADNRSTQNVNRESESETPTVHENPETGNEKGNSTENESATATYQPRPGGNRTRQRDGNRSSPPHRSRGTGYGSGGGSDREDDAHMDGTNTSPHARKEVELAGMKHARHYEKKEGRTPEDVSSENRGYDIYSTSPDGKNRCIEVKARDNRALVVLTSNEWDVAEQLKDAYFLYVVLNATTQPKLYVIQNPADKIAVDKRYEVRYQVPLSEIEEHGKPV